MLPDKLKFAEKPTPLQGGLVVAIAVLGISTAAIWVRLALAAAETSGLGFSLFIAASRLSLAAIALFPTWRTSTPSPRKTAFAYAFAAGACLALHFATWTTSLSFTSIAASTALVTTTPLWVAAISWLWWRERPQPATLLGIAIALAGGLCIALDGSTGSSSHPLLGNSLAFFGAGMASLYILLGREAQRCGLGLGRYAAIAYSMAALLLLPLPPLFGTSYLGYPSLVYLYLFLMTVLCQLIGHTGINWAVRWFSPALVALAILLEPVMSSVLGFIIFGEVPGQWVIAGAAVLLIGVAVSIWGARGAN